MMDAHALLQRLSQRLSPLADAERAKAMSDYMRQQFPFLGIATPSRRQQAKAWWAELGRQPEEPQLLALAEQLWQRAEREYHYIAIDLLIRFAQRLTPAARPVLSYMLQQHSWWDSIDPLSSKVVGPLCLRWLQLQPTLDAWSTDDNLWLRRTALLHQLGFKQQTRADILFGYCEANLDHPDFFIRKGMAWALREYAYTNRAAVVDWVLQHRHRLSALTLREMRLKLPVADGSPV